MVGEKGGGGKQERRGADIPVIPFQVQGAGTGDWKRRFHPLNFEWRRGTTKPASPRRFKGGKPGNNWVLHLIHFG